jgi:hypothetical protein
MFKQKDKNNFIKGCKIDLIVFIICLRGSLKVHDLLIHKIVSLKFNQSNNSDIEASRNQYQKENMTQQQHVISQMQTMYEYNATKQAVNILPYVSHHDALLQQDKRLNREEILKYQNRDVHALLEATNNKFWTLVFHDTSITTFLESYLMYVVFDKHLLLDY